MEYIIKAYSPTLNETQRELNLMNAAPTTESVAWQWANSFAQRLNQTTPTKDWQAQIELVSENHYRTL